MPLAVPLHVVLCGQYAKHCSLVPTLSSSRMYIVSCVLFTVLRTLPAACCLLPVDLCRFASGPRPAACRLRKIAPAAAIVDPCALQSAACCAAVAAAVLGLCHPQTVSGGKTATYLVNLLTRG